MTHKIDRRQFLVGMGLLKTLGPIQLLSLLGKLDQAYAASDRKYLITIRTIFDFWDKSRTNFNNDLGPLKSYQSQMTIATGLGAMGDGGEYHNGKQKRYATACRPGNRDNTTYGGGAFNGKSFDVVVGQHLRSQHKSKVDVLVLGAFPYSSLQTTFETISFANKSQYIRPEYDMNRVLNNIKGDSKVCGSQPVNQTPELLGKENKVIDQVMLDISRTQAGLDTETKEQLQSLESKFAGVKATNEQKIQDAVDFAATCIKIRENPLSHSYSRGATVASKFDPQLRAMNHRAALALKLNYARSVTLNYNFSGHGQGGVRGYHDHTHPGGFTRSPTTEERNALYEISAFQVQMFAHLLKELADMGILNETLIVYSPHERPTHDHRDVPIVAYGANRKGTFAVSNRYNHDVGRDVLSHFSVPNAGSFGGETARGGILA